jgi:hypothetical protein
MLTSNKIVLPLESVLDLPANSPLQRVTIVKRSDKKANITRESMAVDLPKTSFLLEGVSDLQAMQDTGFLQFAFSEIVGELVKAKLADYNTCNQIPDNIHADIANVFTDKTSIFAALKDYVTKQNEVKTRTASASRITKKDSELFMRGDDVKSIFMDLAASVAKPTAWIKPYSEVNKLAFEQGYTAWINIVCVLCTHTVGSEAIERALKVISHFPECEIKTGLLARAETLLNKETTNEDTLGLF